MIEKFLERADVLDFLRECLTDSRFVNTTTSEMFEEDLVLKNQYGLLFAMDALIKFDIIVGDEISIGETLYVTRAYYLINKENKDSYVLNKIPYIVQKKLKELSLVGYPLNDVLSTIDNNMVLSERSEEDYS